ncbi:UDP-N-acetylmuramate--L-alanine ligase [Solirubrobacter ginsenosidimutans]|uniref:UDP-N-acetylmuramate--L-alanine ligase n=1 Tax=Solirubrobacter ginsenosidimutans TaxID=490573 RepID=A0A9X3N0P0_9ACTN|nr:UDP-N-acetylmuramate--L-alanine ligase [Solirubrobacter ginsenosidimutans]MDA0164840.1 UDP-N-acetylmuramate--L-alanine ligase [Solirubrobacter ginsenosidimutans]
MDQPWSGRRLHFVGIGGAGMSGLAVVAHALGASVTGSDRAAGSPYGGPLKAAGIEPTIGHDAANVPEGAEVVYSSAIPPTNAERRPPEMHRADLLGELTRLKPTIAISGTHGKTTTSSMVVHALEAKSYLVGGEVRSTGSNAGWGDDAWLIVEADESDRSLLKLSPTIAVVTNAELDHHTTYASQRDVDDTFAQFLAKATQRVVPENLTRLAEDPTTFAAEPTLSAAGSSFDFDGHVVTLQIPGAHNAANAAAALTAIKLAGGDVAAAAQNLASFEGAGRRFERLGTTPTGALVVDDYAHHPTEVRATIAAARTLQPRRVIACFQPHLFSRTQREATAFGRALARADLAVILDVYPARERAEDFPGVTGLLVAEATADAGNGKRVAWMRTHAAAETFLRNELCSGDVLLTMGAGDVDSIGRALI